jgi:hypothetical protein
MRGSFTRIDYSLRPAKHAERRMLAEIFRKLRPFWPVEDYTYIGLGSLWFSDFILFHRMLGVRRMVSIEREVASMERIKANKPFRSIRLDFRASSVVLPELRWERPYFVWLDYDDPLNMDILLDVQTVAARAKSGTALAVTVQCHRAPDAAAADEDRSGPSALDRFRDRFGRDRVPEGISAEDLYGWPFAELSARMLRSELEASLAVRNSGPGAVLMRFRPICDIEYEDGAKMRTIVGVFVSDSDHKKFADCEFNRLDFIGSTSGSMRIRVPVLTMREIRQLERRLPRSSDSTIKVGAIPPSHARRFAELYRYFPNFAVLES